MKRIVLALAILAAAGCGQAEPQYEPGEAHASAKNTAEPKTSATTAEDALPQGAQTIKIDKNSQVRVEWPAAGDPLLKIIVQWYVTARKAVSEGDKDRFRDVPLELEAVKVAYDWYDGIAAKDQAFKGVVRLYDLRVDTRARRGAQISACVDASKEQMISTRTGRLVPEDPDSPVRQIIRARRGDDGVWRIIDFVYSREGCTR
ncbi:hypothetical protein [Nonomuraea turcica]|uniref:hypothetical protein n=1 Tax=Nonomuraea sp. G32 TaxID=3067274 RepID=UPI00273CF475|nr:hypothetical protein [Nonomuraea sp. G32]MDP4506647.1 hypothetical protein [Nonomuraea sp. G32]